MALSPHQFWIPFTPPKGTRYPLEVTVALLTADHDMPTICLRYALTCVQSHGICPFVSIFHGTVSPELIYMCVSVCLGVSMCVSVCLCVCESECICECVRLCVCVSVCECMCPLKSEAHLNVEQVSFVFHLLALSTCC